MDAPASTVKVADLGQVRLQDLSRYAGDPVLERLLERLLRQVRQPGEAVAGFSSAI